MSYGPRGHGLQVPTGRDARLSLISLGTLKMARVAGQVTAIQTGLLDGLLEPYTGGQKLQTFFLIVMIFLLKEEHPDWFDPIEDEICL